ncbi:MAG: ABC transporter permease [Actinobacteria bacterium]|nr:ABC transporter permease [Actinomycetota bacterium]
MASYIARRVAYLIPIWLGITLLAFLISTLAPGDPAQIYFQRTRGRQPTQQELQIVRERFNLDEPVVEQYLSWLSGAVRGDLGVSFTTGKPVLDELLLRFPATLTLAFWATVVTVVVAIPIGILAAIRRNSVLDQVTRAMSMLGASIPSFWLALLLIILFSVKLQWLPASGQQGWESLILPALALGLGDAAVVARLTRSSLLEIINEDYVKTARAKGLSEGRIMIRHILRNGMGAVVTQIGLAFGFLLAYSAIVEVIFVWPGIGRLAVDAIGQRDYTMIQGFVVFAGSIFVLINLAVDLSYMWLDPRVTLSGDKAVAG